MNQIPALVFCLVVAQAAVQGAPSLPQPNQDEYLRFALREEGDATRGKALFFDETRSCAKCHSVDRKADKAGPDLFATGSKFGRNEIVRAVLSPSASIADGYNTSMMETKSGEHISGILKEATDEWIELMGTDGRRNRVPVRDIAERRISSVSLMPDGLEAGLTLGEFNDLIEYLVSLREVETSGEAVHGMPREIPETALPVSLNPIVPAALSFEKPVWFGVLPGCPNSFFVIEHKARRVWHLHRESDEEDPTKSLFLDLGRVNEEESGLMALAPHPRFRENRKYYVANALVDHGRRFLRVLEFEAAEGCRQDSGNAPRVILDVELVTQAHFGGWLEFGPDGFLYIGTGDSGPQEDPQGNSQNVRLLLGKLLRIDVDHTVDGKSYAVPEDNPFTGRPDMPPEIWAIGFRAPWRFSFDALTGDLWLGDVGQDRYEKVTIVRRGENHGWNVYEAFALFSNLHRRAGETYVPPVFAYTRKYGPSVTGGFVYRANPRSSFYGAYICGDYETRRIFALTQENRVLKTVRQIATAPQRVVSFGIDDRGRIYVVGYEGIIYRMELDDAKFE